MKKEIKLPEISENVTSGEVIAVLVSEGDYIDEQQDVVELETEKAAFEVPSPVAGTVVAMKVEKGQTVNVGDVLATVDTEAEPQTAAQPDNPDAAESPAGRDDKTGEESEQPENQRSPKEAAMGSKNTEGDDEITAGRKQDSESSEDASPPSRQQSDGIALAAPSVRQLARELGVDIARVPGRGPAGRIQSEDVKSFVREQITGRSKPLSPSSHSTRSLPDFSPFGEVEYGELSKTRRIIAETMTYASATIPAVTYFERADVTELEQFRQQYQAQAEAAGTRLSITALMVKVVASALLRFPRFNASVDDENQRIVYKKYVNISVAVDTERGLLAPVVKHVDQKGLLQIAGEIQQLAEQARTKKIKPDDLRGGCFSVSNLGGVGGGCFTPIVYWPDVAILAVNRAVYEPVYVEDEVRRRLMMPLSLSCDHRLLDGADAARFLQWIKAALAAPMSMLL